MTLRSYLLVGYGLLLVLVSLLGLLLINRAGTLNTAITDLNTRIAGVVNTGVKLEQQVNQTRSFVSAYLRSPNPQTLADADQSLEQLLSDLRNGRRTLTDPEKRRYLTDMEQTTIRYRAALYALDASIATQRERADELDGNLAAQASTFNAIAINIAQTNDINPQIIMDIAQIKNALQQARLGIVRMQNEQSERPTIEVLSELALAQTLADRNVARVGPDILGDLQSAVAELERMQGAVGRLVSSIRQVSANREALFQRSLMDLHIQTNTLIGGALSDLSIGTAQLEQETVQVQGLAGILLAIIVIASLALGWHFSIILTRPLLGLQAAAGTVRQGDYATQLQPHGYAEVRILQEAFNHMTSALQQQRTEVLEQQQALGRRNQELAIRLEQINATRQEGTQLAGTLRSLTAPIVPVARGILSVPLVGEFDAVRFAELQRRVVQHAKQERATVVVLDLTGVPQMNEGAAGLLRQLADMLTLIGARCALVGIKPSIALTLTDGEPIEGHTLIYRDLQSAIEHLGR